MSVFPIAGRWPQKSPLEYRCAVTPGRPAVLDASTGTEWSYRELSAAVDDVATRLQALLDIEPTEGTEPTKKDKRRPRIGYLLSPSPAFVTILYGLWRLGWIPVGLHTELTAGELETMVSTAELDAVVYETSFENGVEGMDCPAVSVESVCEWRGQGTLASISETRSVSPATWSPDGTALILFTSGTTGEPKGVRLTLGNLASSATASAFRLGVEADDRWLCCLPVSHMGGLAPAVRTVMYGTTLVVQRQFDVRDTAEILAEFRITDISLVPTQLTRLLDSEWSPPDSLETVLLGGAPATQELLERCDEADVPAYPTYGMTETASQIATARPAERREYPGTVGSPLVCTEVTVLEEGTPVERGQRGEIVVDGPTVTPGYLDDQHTDEVFSEYGFHTGDVGCRDDGGRLFVLGRRDDVIITGGELVSPGEVVETLLDHDSVVDVAVVGIPDEEWGEQVAAVVVPEEGKGLSMAALRAYCKERVAAFKVPKTIVFESEIPRTASGTVDRDSVRGILSMKNN